MSCYIVPPSPYVKLTYMPSMPTMPRLLLAGFSNLSGNASSNSACSPATAVSAAYVGQPFVSSALESPTCSALSPFRSRTFRGGASASNGRGVKRRADGTEEYVVTASGERLPLYCKVCRVTLNAPAQAKQHYEGKTHAKRLKLFGDGDRPILPQRRHRQQAKELNSRGFATEDSNSFVAGGGGSADWVTSPSSVSPSSSAESGDDDNNQKTFDSDLPTAVNSEAKEALVVGLPSSAAANSRDDVIERKRRRGSFHGTTITSSSSRHSTEDDKKVDEDVEAEKRKDQGKSSAAEDNPEVYCKVCCVSFNSPKQSQQHYQGKNHAKRLKAQNGTKDYRRSRPRSSGIRLLGGQDWSGGCASALAGLVPLTSFPADPLASAAALYQFQPGAGGLLKTMKPFADYTHLGGHAGFLQDSLLGPSPLSAAAAAAAAASKQQLFLCEPSSGADLTTAFAGAAPSSTSLSLTTGDTSSSAPASSVTIREITSPSS